MGPQSNLRLSSVWTASMWTQSKILNLKLNTTRTITLFTLFNSRSLKAKAKNGEIQKLFGNQLLSVVSVLIHNLSPNAMCHACTERVGHLCRLAAAAPLGQTPMLTSTAESWSVQAGTEYCLMSKSRMNHFHYSTSDEMEREDMDDSCFFNKFCFIPWWGGPSKMQGFLQSSWSYRWLPCSHCATEWPWRSQLQEQKTVLINEHASSL